VIIDSVFNHTSTDCPLEMIDHNYWVCYFLICFYLTPILTLVLQRKTSSRWYVGIYFFFDIDFLFIDPFYWGPELNYEYYDEQQNLKPACKFASDVVHYWISEFHLDGIRFDAGKVHPNVWVLIFERFCC
jgi:1,4-alpha-glucan branching enzyme